MWPLIWICTDTREPVKRKKKKLIAKTLIMNPSTLQWWMASLHDDDDPCESTPREKSGAILTITYVDKIRPHSTVMKYKW